MRTKGTVLWFNDAKGYGFIKDPNNENIFVHYSAIKTDGFKTLAEGDSVSFEIEGKKGKLSALDVQKEGTNEANK